MRLALAQIGMIREQLKSLVKLIDEPIGRS
jgi:hypothetical protein